MVPRIQDGPAKNKRRHSKALRCPHCQTRLVRLAPQQGIGERLLGFLTIYPIRCQLCAHRFLTFHGKPGFLPQRNFQRLRVGFLVWFRSALTKTSSPGVQGTLADLSIGGGRVECKVRPPKGSRLRLQIEVSEDQAPVEVEEAVVRTHTRQGIGLAFTRVTGKEKRRISRIIHERLSPSRSHGIQGRSPERPSALG